jgi:hypothetical protein
MLVKEVKAQVERGRGTGTSVSSAKPPKFDGTTSWAVFRSQFETTAQHNCWVCPEKYTYSITALQALATDILHRVPKGATYEETLEAQEDRFKDQHLATAYRSQLQLRTQSVVESLQEFGTAIKQLAHCTYLALPEDHIGRDAGKAFAPIIKTQLLLGEEKTVNETPRQALQLQAVLLEGRPTKKEHHDILGESITPNQAERPKTIGVLQLWGARPLPG